MRKTPYNMLSELIEVSKGLDGRRRAKQMTIHHSMNKPNCLSGHGWTIETLPKDMIRVEFDFSNLDNVTESIMCEEMHINCFDPERLVAQREAIETVYNAYIKPYLNEFWQFANDTIYVDVHMDIIPIEIRPDEVQIFIRNEDGAKKEISGTREDIFFRTPHAFEDIPLY